MNSTPRPNAIRNSDSILTTGTVTIIAGSRAATSSTADAFSDPDREYGIATQLHHPVGPTDTVLDFRQARSIDTDNQRL